MANVKLLISGLSNSGKTTMLQTLTDVIVFCRDGKKYPFKQPHVNVPDFDNVGELLGLIEVKIHAYKEKFGKFPKTIVFDSFSKIALDIEGNILKTVKSFPYGVINVEIKALVDFIETELTENFNIVLVSHALHDVDTDSYTLVNAGGSWGKKGGVISEVSEAIFVEIKGKKRVVHTRTPKMLSRSMLSPEQLTSTIPVDDFNLQEHMNNLEGVQSEAEEFIL